MTHRLKLRHGSDGDELSQLVFRVKQKHCIVRLICFELKNKIGSEKVAHMKKKVLDPVFTNTFFSYRWETYISITIGAST